MVSQCPSCQSEYSGDSVVCRECQRNGAHVVNGTCYCPVCNKPVRELSLLTQLRTVCHELMLGNVDREMAEMQCGCLVLEAMATQREVVIG